MMNRLAQQANQIRWDRVLFIVIGLIQAIYVASIINSQARGIPALLRRDIGLPPAVLALFFVFGAVRFVRGIKARPTLLIGLLPLAVYCSAGLFYVARGQLGITALAPHGGILILSAISILSRLDRAWRRALYPAITIGMMIYACGIAAQPHQGVPGYINAQGTELAGIALALMFAVAGSFVLDENLKPHKLFVVVVPQFFYSFASVGYYFSAGMTLPLTGVLSHWMLSFLVLTIVLSEVEAMDE